MPERFEAYFSMLKKGDISIRGAAKQLGMSHVTFYRRCKEKMKDIEENVAK